MVNQGEPELLGEGRSHCVVHRGGEGHEDRVSLEGEDNPPDLYNRSVVADRVAEGRAKLCGQAFLPDITEGEALHEVL